MKMQETALGRSKSQPEPDDSTSLRVKVNDKFSPWMINFFQMSKLHRHNSCCGFKVVKQGNGGRGQREMLPL